MKILLKLVLLIISISSILLWLLVFYYLYDVGESNNINYIKGSISSFVDTISLIPQTKVDKLAGIGSIFNIITSLTSVFIVILVSTGVYLQKKELESLKEQVNNQISNSKEDYKINRTFNEIEKWIKIKSEVEVDKYSRNKIKLFCDYIDWIESLRESKLKEFIDFDSLMSVVKESTTSNLLLSMRESLSSEIDHFVDDVDFMNEYEVYETGQRPPLMEHEYAKSKIYEFELADQLYQRIDKFYKEIN